MHPKLLDILSRKEVPIENAMLAKYLKGELDEASRQSIEEKLQAGSDMEQDAWDGWQQAGADHLLTQADKINRHIESQLFQPAKRPRRKPIVNFPLTWWMMGLIIVLILFAWAIIRLMLH